MDKRRKEAKHILQEATLQEYQNAIKAAKLTPMQAEIIDRIIIKDEFVVKIALQMHVDASVIKRLAQKAYDKLAKVLLV